MANYTNHNNNKPLSPEIVAQIKKRFSNGEPKTRIAVEIGISHSAVRKYTDPLPWKIKPQVKEKALRLLSEGHTKSSIARLLGVNRKWVANLIPKNETFHALTEEIKKELLSRVQAGEAVRTVARQLEIDAGHAYHIVNLLSRRPNERENQEIQALILKGMSATEIARLLRFPLVEVRKLQGRSSAVRYSEEQKLEMAQLYSDGIKLGQISLAFDGVTQSVIVKSYRRALDEGKVSPRLAIAMEDDRDLIFLRKRYPQYEQWFEYIVAWYKIVKGNFNLIASSLHRFIRYLFENSLYEYPIDFLLKSNAKKIPNFFENACSESDYGAALNNALVDFLDWVLRQTEFCDTSEDGENFVLPMYGNPIASVRRSDHKVRRGSESTKRVMPYWMIHDLRRRIAQGVNFQDWKWVQDISGKITYSGDKESASWFEVDERTIDKLDPDCVWRVRSRIDASPILEMWSPVRWVACLLKLQTTARMGQIRMLDSGEADTIIYQNGAFQKNVNNLAQGTMRRPRRQGAIRDGESGVLCLYLNTNKTADISKVGEKKGMECPWPNIPEYQDNPYYWIDKLARWQSKFNPIEKPISWKDIPSTRRLKGKSEKDCDTYVDTVFLLRTAESKGFEQFPIAAGSCDYAWQKIVGEYEKILEHEGKVNLDGSKIELIVDGRAEVTVHGLRVSLITHLIMDGGVPPEIMMKIVGHARFIMTIYYTKPGLQRIEDALHEAALKLDATKDETLIRDLKSRSAEHIRNHVVFNAQELIEVIPANPADRSPLGWLPLHDGICLAGGNTGPVSGDVHFPGCHNGGPPIGSDHRNFGPVPGGVRNCSRCRWKCAGKHHALGLQATLNNRQFHLHKASTAAIEVERKRNDLVRNKAISEAADVPFMAAKELLAAERLYEAAMHKMQELALDVAAIYRLIERIQGLPDSPGGPTALAAQADLMTLHTLIEDTDSELLVLAEVCADVEFFPDLDPGTAVYEFSELLDRAFEREGQPLVLARMSEKDKLVASNAIMRELEKAANSKNKYLARKMVVEIMDRQESLETILGVNLKKITQSVRTSISNAHSLRLTPQK